MAALDIPRVPCSKQLAPLSPRQWEQRPGGQLHDTLKPLATNRLDLRSTLLIDNEAHKGARGEEANMVELPTWEHCQGGGTGCALPHTVLPGPKQSST